MSQDLSTVILDTLHQAGVEHVFGIPGDAINGFVDAIRRHDHIEFVTVRHEEAAAFAASAQAKLTGRLGVVAGTAGPGAIHLLNGLYDAKLDRAPVLAITGQVDSDQLGTTAHQEVDLEALFADVAVFSEEIVDPEQMPQLIHNAVREAIIRRGVSHLVLPSNMALASSPEAIPLTIPSMATPIPADVDLSAACELLREGSNVTILAGIGARDAVEEIAEIAELVGAPIVLSLRAKELFAQEHPLVLGGLGLLGTGPAVDAISRTDVLLMVGTDFPYREFYPERARTIQVDLEPTHIGRRTQVDVALVGDAAATLRSLIPALGVRREDRSHLQRAQSDMREWLESEAKAETDDSTPLRPQRVAAAVGNATEPGTIFVCDTGAVTVWAARNLHLSAGDRFTLSSSLASMAFALPGAIGAKMAYPDRRVVALIGDGGFSMLIGELLTAVTLGLDLLIVVFNNSKLGLIEMEQMAEGLPHHATGLANPDFAAVARAMGAGGWRVESPDELDTALRAALAESGPLVIDVAINPEEVTMPPSLDAKYVTGFVKAKVKEMADGDLNLDDVRQAIKQGSERVL